MRYQFNQEELQFISSILHNSVSSANLAKVWNISRRSCEKGWFLRADMEDMLCYFDSRFCDYRFEIMSFSKKLGVRWDAVCYTPKKNASSVMEFDALSLNEATLFLIILERLGFNVNPEILVDFILPRINSNTKEMLNVTELEIFWYKQTRHKFSKIELTLLDKEPIEQTIQKFETTGNYKIEILGVSESEITSIEVISPKFRKRPRLIEVKCEVCGVNWHKGDVESSYMHRLEHARRMKYLNPKPSRLMLDEMKDAAVEYELVRNTSSKWKQKEIYLRATAFRREFGYDFVQWNSPTGGEDPNVHGFLFTNNEGIIVGACAFRLRNHEGGSNWWLDWVWVMPKERRKGHLANRWSAFRKRFGDFHLSPPVSKEMQAFLMKQGDDFLLNQ